MEKLLDLPEASLRPLSVANPKASLYVIARSAAIVNNNFRGYAVFLLSTP